MGRKFRFEAHVHTKYSKDSALFFWPLYLKCRACGIDVIAITDHNTVYGGIQFAEFCKKHGDRLKVIVGEEIMTAQGEIIGLFLDHTIAPGLPAKQTIALIKEQNGVVYVPHPFDTKRVNSVLQEQVIAENKPDIMCIEVHNGRNILPLFSDKQLEIAQKYDICPVVGSDAHTYFELARNYMEISAIPTDLDTFYKEIQNATFVKRDCLKLCHTITKVEKLLKLLGRGNFDEIYRLIVKRIRKHLSSGR